MYNTSPSITDTCLDRCKGSKKALQVIYDLLQSFTSPSTSCLMEEWEKELGVEISEEMWQTGLKDINEHSTNSRHCSV